MTASANDSAPALDRLGFKLNFFKLQTADIERLATFFRDAFGLEERDRIDLPTVVEIMLAMPGEQFTLVLLSHKDGRAYDHGAAMGPLGFLTRDVDGAIERVQAHGGSLLHAPAELPGMRYAFVADPDGHQIELMQFVRPANPALAAQGVQ